VATEGPGQGGGGAGTAAPGDILFVRQGQIWAIAADGSRERALTPAAPDSVINDLALSPNGFYLTFTVNSTQLTVLDLQAGQTMPVDTVDFGSITSLTWMPDSSAVYYQKITLDPTTSLPSRSAVMLSAIPTEGGPNTVVESDLASQPALAPRFALTTHVLVQDVSSGGNGPGDWFLLDVQSQALTPIVSGFTLTDISPDGLRVLLLGSPDGAGAAPVYIADFIGTSLSTPAQITPPGETVIYSAPQFSPDGAIIAALRRDLAQPDLPAELVVLAPDGAGGFTATPLAGLPDVQIVGFVWQDATRLIVQGVPVSGLDTDLWLVPTAPGTAATRLTTGSSPWVVTAP
jgi:Tol biopolymer transport system component